MLRLTCLCGETIDLPISFMGEAADCPLCGKSFALGKYAWPLLGRPNSNLETPIASAARQRLGVPTLFSPQ